MTTPREIKFRVWDSKHRQMYYPKNNTSLEVYWNSDYGSEIYQSIIDSNGCGTCTETDCSIMQFTGICDMNGNEIYEGDKMSYCNATGIVKFEAGAFMIDFGDISELLYGVHTDYIVSGNIHEE